jgi:hypothetical protein
MRARLTIKSLAEPPPTAVESLLISEREQRVALFRTCECGHDPWLRTIKAVSGDRLRGNLSDGK